MRDYGAEVVEAISNGEGKATINAKINSAWSGLLADIGRSTASLVAEFEGSEPGGDLHLNLTKIFEALSGIFGDDGLGSDSPDRSHLERVVAKMSECHIYHESANIAFNKMFVPYSVLQQSISC
jgi:hypothetical protein